MDLEVEMSDDGAGRALNASSISFRRQQLTGGPAMSGPKPPSWPIGGFASPGAG